jgi:hypothetical protein
MFALLYVQTYNGLGLLLLGLSLLPGGFGLLGDLFLRSELLLAVAGRVKNILRSLDIVFQNYFNQSIAALKGEFRIQEG